MDIQHSSSSAPAPRPSKMAHVVFRTRDRYDEMIEWYCTVLNAHKVFESEMLTFLAYDEEHHRIAIGRAPHLAPRAPCSIGFDHLAFTYADIDELLATHRRLKAAGIEPYCPVNHGPTTSLYYKDPDGNRIELQVDNFDDMAEATAHMQAAFTVNPVGQSFDPEDYARRRQAGEAQDAIVRQPVETLSPPSPELIGKLMPD